MHPEDQLMQRAKLDHRAEFYPLGFPVQIATNSPAVLCAAEESWRGWEAAFDRPPLDMRVIVHLDGPVPRQEPTYRAQGNLFTLIGDNANFGICDVERGYCFACVTPAVASAAYFRNHLLETMAYFTLDYLHITILHAGCVARNGRGVLLCGEPGAGKSCLAYACVKQGWTLLADDFSAILRRPRGRMVIGKPERIRLRPDALQLFPELAGAQNQVTQCGKHMFDLRTAEMPRLQTARSCQAEAVVFLDRGAAAHAALAPMSAEEALARFEFDRPYWDPPVFDEHRENMRALLAHGVSRLCYGNSGDAIRILESLVS